MRIILFLWTILIAISATGQKAPVRFIPIDSISLIRPGQEVKLDFKTDEQKVGQYPPAYPSLRGASPGPDYIHWYGDTINLTIEGQKIEFIERKGKTVDWYLFLVECLMSRTYKKGHLLVVPFSTILTEKTDSISFRLTIELYKQKNKGWRKINTKTTDIWLNKDQLDGLLISEIDDEPVNLEDK